MEEQPLVVLFGDSLFMDTVEASLEHSQGLGVMRIHATVADVVERLKSLSPDLVILDLNAPQTQFVVPFLQEQAGIPLLCLDVNVTQVVTLSSQHHTAQTAGELLELVHTQASNGNGCHRGPGGSRGLDRFGALQTGENVLLAD
jgi:DNA-binding NarL/FixJ family response regulator